MMRVWSPSSGSTLMTSAPWSASSMVQNGPANICVRSTMRTPSSAPRGEASLMVQAFLPTRSVGRWPRSGRRGQEASVEAHDPSVGVRRRHLPKRCLGRKAFAASLVAPVAAALDQDGALTIEDLLVVLVHAIVAEAHDAGVRAVGIARFQHLGVAIERVAVMHRCLESDLVQTQLHQCILRGVLGGKADAHRDGDATEAEPLAPRARLHEMLVEMALGGVHGDVGDPHLLERLDGLAAGVAQDLADGEVLEVAVPAGKRGDLHQFLPRPSRRSEMMRFWISEVPSKILVSRASRQWRSTACRVV